MYREPKAEFCHEAGKGSKTRKIDLKKFNENFDKIVFNHDKPKNINEKGG